MRAKKTLKKIVSFAIAAVITAAGLVGISVPAAAVSQG